MPSKVMGMTAKGYVNMSVWPSAKAALLRAALDISHELGRRVSLSEAIEHLAIADRERRLAKR